MSEYYQVPGREVLKKLNGSEEPLTSQQVREHQEKYGRNELAEMKRQMGSLADGILSFLDSKGDDSSHFSGTV